MNHQSKSALEKDIEPIRQTISRKCKENQYCSVSRRRDVVQASYLDAEILFGSPVLKNIASIWNTYSEKQLLRS